MNDWGSAIIIKITTNCSEPMCFLCWGISKHITEHHFTRWSLEGCQYSTSNFWFGFLVVVVFFCFVSVWFFCARNWYFVFPPKHPSMSEENLEHCWGCLEDTTFIPILNQNCYFTWCNGWVDSTAIFLAPSASQSHWVSITIALFAAITRDFQEKESHTTLH